MAEYPRRLLTLKRLQQLQSGSGKNKLVNSETNQGLFHWKNNLEISSCQGISEVQVFSFVWKEIRTPGI